MARNKPIQISSEELYERYGPFKEITRQEEAALLEKGEWRFILCVMSSGDATYAGVGHHLVNVDTILKSTKEMPAGLEVEDFWFIEPFTDDLGHQVRRLKGVLQDLVDQMERVSEHPAYKYVWEIHQLHNGQYKGPKYEKEFKAAKKLLKEMK